jgi:hypothetical protein
VFFTWRTKVRRLNKAREELIQSYISDQKILTTEKEQLFGENKELELRIELQKRTNIFNKADEELKKNILKSSNLYLELHEKANDDTKAEELAELLNKLYVEIDNLWPKFRKSLRTLLPSVNENEIALCCLLKANLRVSQIKYYLLLAENSVSTKRTRLAKKLFGEHATIQDLDNFIHHDIIPSRAVLS